MKTTKQFISLILTIILISTTLFSTNVEPTEENLSHRPFLSAEYIDDLLNENTQEIAQRGVDAYNEERYQDAVHYFLQYWQTQRDSYNALLYIAQCYDALANPELAGRFYLEAQKRARLIFSKETSERTFANVWDDDAFQPYKNQVFDIIDSRENERGFMSYLNVLSKIRYRTILPDNFDSEKEYNVMIYLHGHGGNPFNITPFSTQFQENNMILVVPQAPYPWELSNFVNTSYSWMIVDFDEGDYNEDHSILLTQNYIVSLNNAIREKYNVSSMFLGGFSQGGYQTLSIGLQNQDIFNGLVCFGGGLALPEEFIPENGTIPVLIVHGESDTVVSYETGVDAYERLKHFGYDVELYPFDGAHVMTNEIINKAIEWMIK